MNQLKNKTALITGGGSGIGKASAILFAKEGAKIVIAGRRENKCMETINIIKENGGDAFYVKADISKKDEVVNLVDKTIEKYGKIDCAFNCAGIDGKKAPLIDLEEDEWNDIININLKGTFLLLKYEIKQMLKQGYGSIVNMASVCSFIAREKRSAYNSSRHGVVGLTKTAALEYAKSNIRINAIAPGSIKTDIYYRSTNGNPDIEKTYAELHPIGRVGQPEEAANAALWLCSDASSFVIGNILLVDGGFTIR